MHAAVQAPSQQTPCAQNPDLHSLAWLQSVPFSLSPHDSFVQMLPSEHCAVLVHEPKHVLPLHL